MPDLHFWKAVQKELHHPSWCGSLDRVTACGLKGRRFDSQSGHIPGLWARQHARGNHTLMFVSLSFSLPSPLSKNK